MRILEILTILSLLASTAFLFRRPDRGPGWLRAALLAPSGLVLLHLIFEGSRWQMAPFYFLAMIFALLALKQFRQRDGAIRDRKAWRLTGALSALLLLLVASPLPYLFPVFEMPDPGGPYQIGTKMFRFVDESRPETFSPHPDDFREVTVQVWYPATPAPGSRPEPYRELDMEKVGVLGWSFGGATAGQIMVTDDRFKAGLNMDGGLGGDVLDSALTRPFFFMERGNKAGLDRLFFKRATGPAYYATIAGTRHVNFGDISIHGDFWRLIGLLGEIDGQRGLEIINRYTLAFFDRHLKQREAPLLDGQALEYPEVQLQRRNVGGVTNALPQTKPNFF